MNSRGMVLNLIVVATLAALSANAQTRPAALRSGSVPTQDSQQLTLNADAGSVRVFSDASGEVRYEARVRIPQSNPAAEAIAQKFEVQARKTSRGVTLTGRLGEARGLKGVQVNYEVHVPRRYSLAIATRAGDILTQDIEGQAVLETGGGNIRAGRIGGAARLDSGGGEVLVGDVAGALRASTAGGHISAGDVAGSASLRTDGGHIQVGRVRGAAQFLTGGGNIVAGHIEEGVTAETAGGRIEFGDAAGAVHLRSGGGGVRIAHVARPMQVDCSNGGIQLAGVEAPLRASATAGGITAWFSPRFGDANPGTASGTSELASRLGDIVVYLPRQLAVTIDAFVEQGHRIVADPAFPVKVRAERSAAGNALHAQAALNGGGEVLHLKTSGGDIQLRFLEGDAERRLASQQIAAIEQEMAAQRMMLFEMERETEAAFQSMSMQAAGPAVSQAGTAPQDRPSAEALGAIARLFEGIWRGGVEVAPEEEQKRLVQAVRPGYPEAAREAGLQGDVTLRVVIGPDGAVRDVRPISGDPELARAAMRAVSQWRYAPATIDGLPVNVITTVTLAFRLR